MTVLQTLLHSYPVEQFLKENWTQRAVHLTAPRQRFQSLFGWASLNHLLNYQCLTAPTIRFSQDGQTLPHSRDPRRWREYLQQGATLIINELHWRVPTIATLATQLHQELGSRTQVNLYCSSPQQQGFDCHYDTHEVFILQIDGSKEWVIYPPTIPFPTSETRSPDHLPPEGDPELHCLVQPGDLLYIPRGHWHYAVAQDSISLHLTLGIHIPTGLEWLDWVSQHLADRPEWRQGLRLVDPDCPESVHHLGSHLSQLAEHLQTFLRDPATLHCYANDLALQDQPHLPLDLPLQMRSDLFADGLISRFAWSPWHRVRIKSVAVGHYQLIIGSKQIDLKGIPDALVEQMSDHESFSLFDLAEWAPELDVDTDLVPLLERLVQAGILHLDTVADPSLTESVKAY
ncbi:MAG: hypothetical protein OHK0012_21700 [Synechococcales cyanobacterium]